MIPCITELTLIPIRQRAKRHLFQKQDLIKIYTRSGFHGAKIFCFPLPDPAGSDTGAVYRRIHRRRADVDRHTDIVCRFDVVRHRLSPGTALGRTPGGDRISASSAGQRLWVRSRRAPFVGDVALSVGRSHRVPEGLSARLDTMGGHL